MLCWCCVFRISLCSLKAGLPSDTLCARAPYLPLQLSEQRSGFACSLVAAPACLGRCPVPAACSDKVPSTPGGWPAGAQWEKAAELFEQMQTRGCKPDSVTYGGLILAYEKGGQWRKALAAFEQMKQNNCRPDSVVYNTTVGLLWNTGVVWAQAKAIEVSCRNNSSVSHLHHPTIGQGCSKLWQVALAMNQSLQKPCMCATRLQRCCQSHQHVCTACRSFRRHAGMDTSA